MNNTRKSFLQRLTGSFKDEDEEALEKMSQVNRKSFSSLNTRDIDEDDRDDEIDEDDEIDAPITVEGQLGIDLFETPVEVIVKTMIPGVRKEDIDISLSRDMLTIRGERKDEKTISEDDYHFRELYWGTFSRTVKLPHEVDIDKAEATESQGMLTLRLPRIDRERKASLKVKNM
ncbi:Hsp20/alpha crystallin family protein [Candidatus Parcubacteria bacterium]|nr:Hsp20/alpha crystallin family protein [Candidatus Parcubacteria bacterium]